MALIGSLLAALIAFFNPQTPTKISYSSVEETQTPNLAESMERGAVLYKEFCIRCHKAKGEGYKKFYPPLASSDWLTNKRRESIHAVKYGLKGLITVNGEDYKKSMSNPGMENHEIADVMNYIMNNWGNTQTEMVTPQEVKDIIE